ncbi:MAG: type II secretion system protein [Planctomycetota bacterium]
MSRHHCCTYLPTQRSHWGFTLVELLIVISIIAVLAGMLIPAISLVRENARVAEAKQAVAQLVSSIEQYASNDDQKRYPFPGPLGILNPYGPALPAVPASITYHHYDEATDPELAFSLCRHDNRAGTVIDGVITLLDTAGLPLPVPHHDPGDTDRRLLDPWKHPYRYRFSLPLATRSAFACTHGSSVDLTLPDWNWDATNNYEKARNGRDITKARPYPYVYSWGKKGSATDPCTWIYRP